MIFNNFNKNAYKLSHIFEWNINNILIISYRQMNKIKIIGNEEKSGINKYLFIGTKPKISLLFLNANLTKIIILI